MTTMQMIMTFITLGIPVVLIFVIVDGIPSKHSQRIKFNHFINLYTINPDRWELFGRYVDFVKPVEGYYKSWKETVMFQFNIIDYYRYQHWKRNLEKQKRQEKECKQLQEVISIIKSDLKKFEQENTERINKAAEDSAVNIRGTVLCKSKVQDIQSILNIHRK